MRAINAVSSQTGVVAEDFLPDERMPGVGAMFRLASKEGETLHVMNDSDPSLGIVFRTRIGMIFKVQLTIFLLHARIRW